MYICPECLIILDDKQLKNNRCPVVTNHANVHRPLLKVDDDIAHSILRCLRKGYNVTSYSGAQRNYLNDSDNPFEQLNPKLPHVTFGFTSKLECDNFYQKFKHLNHLMQNWEIEGISCIHRIDEELQVISHHVLQSKRTQRDMFEVFKTTEFYEIRFIGGGTKFSPAIMWDSIYFRDMTEEQKSQKEVLLKDFYDSYFDYCKDFFAIFDEICA